MKLAGRSGAMRANASLALAVLIPLMPLALFGPQAARAADMSAVNHAARIASGVGAGTAVPSLGFGAVLQTVVGLAVVIGLVFACAWLARRLGLQPSRRGGLVKVIGGASLGQKERVAVVEIGDTWLVLGAAPGNVRLLHTLPAGTAGVEGAAAYGGGPAAPGGMHAAPQGTFGQRFRAALSAEASKRLQRRASGDQ
jgi:flagellar protein FliO/FliZ